jgi:tetratricopeptide (TPR) repeat protein
MKKEKKFEQVDFEIAFYENLVKEKPDFIEALIPLGDAYTKRGYYEKGLEVDRKLCALKPDDSTMWYNLSCSLSLLNRTDEALDAIKKSLSLGYSDIEYLLSDSDLINLRKDPSFKELIFKLKGQNN